PAPRETPGSSPQVKTSTPASPGRRFSNPPVGGNITGLMTSFIGHAPESRAVLALQQTRSAPTDCTSLAPTPRHWKAARVTANSARTPPCTLAATSRPPPKRSPGKGTAHHHRTRPPNRPKCCATSSATSTNSLPPSLSRRTPSRPTARAPTRRRSLNRRRQSKNQREFGYPKSTSAIPQSPLNGYVKKRGAVGSPAYFAVSEPQC